MNTIKGISAALVAWTTLACGTYLDVSQTTASPEHAEGVVVNRRASYSVEFSIGPSSPIDATPRGSDVLQKLLSVSVPGADITGLDSRDVVVIGICRMPFSSGKLGVTLGADQVPRKVEISSQTGAARALEVEKARLERRKAIEKAEDEAKK